MTVLAQIANGSSGADVRETLNDLVLAAARTVPSRAALAATATPAAGAVRYLADGDRSGLFRFVGGDQSALVTSDPLKGLCVAPDAAASGATSGTYGDKNAWFATPVP